MENLQIFWQQLLKMQWSDYLDILAVAALIYWLLPVLRSTGTMRVAKVAVVIVVVAWLTEFFHLHTLYFLLSRMLTVGLIALVVLFQPELRRVIDHVSSVRIKKFFAVQRTDQELLPVITQVVRACDVMSRERVGALMVFERKSHLDEYFKTGTIIDGQVSEQLIRNIFFPKAALHDGAVIIREGRVAVAGCVLPLSDSDRISAELGTRHRAGVGMSETSDAVVVIVSEETGAISVAVGGILKRHLAPQTLERLLINELCPEDENREENLAAKLRKKLHKEKGGEADEK